MNISNLAVGPRRNAWLLYHALLTVHAFLRCPTWRPAHSFVCWFASLFASRLSTAWCWMLGSHVTNKHASRSPIFRTIRLQQRDHSFRYTVCFTSVAVMALHRNILQEDNILCELYADTRFVVSDYSDSESLDSDIDVPTISSYKQLRSSTGPLTPQFPHPFFLTSIKTFFITVWD